MFTAGATTLVKPAVVVATRVNPVWLLAGGGALGLPASSD